MTYFFNMISEADTLFYVGLVWIFNVLIILKGTKTIEPVVKIFVPLMWLMMIVLIVRGITLPNGLQGVLFLFTPDFTIMKEVDIWKGAFSQMFFTLSLGFGIMAAYASYLPKDSDDVQNATTISLMNCSFEFIAGVAIFSLLFAFAIVPKASTIAMMFFVVPEGIARFPVMVTVFGLLFFTLLLMAGLTSSVSLVEAVVLSIMDKFKVSRSKVILGVFIVGMGGSIVFALPQVVDKGLANDGTLGFTLLDFFDHWAFGYGLLLCGLLEVIILGWLYDIDKLLGFINKTARYKLGGKFKFLVRFILPLVILFILVWSVGFSESGEVRKGLYGFDYFEEGACKNLYLYVFFGWIAFSIVGALLFTVLKRRQTSEDRS
jgi:NSS family neurotransmitter:Na+ symporter